MTRRTTDWTNVANQLQETLGKTSTKKQPRKEGEFYPGEEWKANLFNPTLKEDGTYNCVIRFLPRPESDSDGSPFVLLKKHSFQAESGKWFIQNCNDTVKTPGKDRCPICKEYSDLFKVDEVAARKRKAKSKYYANILVVTDKITPENEGKVFIMEIDAKLFTTIWDKMFPPADSDEEAVQVADYDAGMDFRLKIKTNMVTLNGKPTAVKNKDASQFTGVVRALTDAEYKLAEAGLHSLDVIVKPSNFKTNDELVEIYTKVTGQTEFKAKEVAPSWKKAELTEQEDETPTTVSTRVVVSEDDEDDEAFLRKLRGN